MFDVGEVIVHEETEIRKIIGGSGEETKNYDKQSKVGLSLRPVNIVVDRIVDIWNDIHQTVFLVGISMMIWEVKRRRRCRKLWRRYLRSGQDLKNTN